VRRRISILITFGTALLLAGGLSGCFNTRLTYQNAASSDASTLTTLTTTTGTGTSALVITQVLISDKSSGSIDIIGDGTGNVGNYCITDSTNNNTITCSCSYRYTYQSTEYVLDANASYFEPNLIRCPYTNGSTFVGIPSSVSDIYVTVKMTNTGGKSNELWLHVGGAAGGLDTQSEDTFLPVQRYECGRVVSMPYLLDANVYDPIESENPANQMPINFYTTNLGSSIAYYASETNNKGTWYCPANLTTGLLGDGLSKIWSENPDASGSYTIWPNNSTFDRSTFYVAKAATGVFNIAVNALIAPNKVSAPASTATDRAKFPPVVNGSSPPPLGYGASPTAVSGTTGEETCPDSSVLIPDGNHWAKLGLFRADYPPIRQITSTKLSQMVTTGVYCNTSNIMPYCIGDHVGNSATSTSDVPYKSQDAGLYFLVNSPNGVTTYWNEDGYINWPNLVQRMVPLSTSTYNCYADYAGQYSSTSSLGGTAHVDTSSYAQGSDFWIADGFFPADTSASPNPSDRTNPVQTRCYGNDLASVCEGTESTTDYTTVQDIPHFTDMASQDLSGNDGDNFPYDFLFVVTPTTVHSKTMKDGATESLKYTPFRMYSKSDCDSDTPKSTLTCDSDGANYQRKLLYGLKVHDVTTQGDLPASDSSRPGIFPLCVLQPDL